MNFYPFHIGDYISHTSHLTDEEDLAYRRMIDLYYMTETPFPNDAAWIARRVKSNPAIVLTLLNEFFELEDDGLWHSSRADKEIAKYQYLQESGKKGAEKRWGNRDVKLTNSVPNSPPIATLIATKTKNQDHITTPDGVSESIFKDYLEVRKTKKAKWTDTALKGLQREANKANISLEKAMQICCERNWVGIKAEWLKDEVQQVEKVKFI
jgi:uncharacterized protein YdaU (DUF1376 family)